MHIISYHKFNMNVMDRLNIQIKETDESWLLARSIDQIFNNQKEMYLNHKSDTFADTESTKETVSKNKAPMVCST